MFAVQPAVALTAVPSRFIAKSRQLVAKAFSFRPAGVLSALVRSYQLCFVAGSLWARPHVFVANGNAPLA